MEDKLFIQVIDFKSLVGFVKEANTVGVLSSYQLPNRAIDYVEDLGNLTETLINTATDEKWRIKKEQGLRVSVTEEGAIVLNDKKVLFDAATVYAMTDINSFIIVPGENSVSNGGFNPCEVLQMSNLIALKPLLLTLVKRPIDEEKGVWALDAVFKGN